LDIYYNKSRVLFVIHFREKYIFMALLLAEQVLGSWYFSDFLGKNMHEARKVVLMKQLNNLKCDLIELSYKYFII